MIGRVRLCIILVASFCQVSFAQNPTVEIDDGRIEGIVMKSRLGKDFAAFRGIPFAEPPLGELRFLNPIPVKPWTDTLYATKDGPMCSQPTGLPNSEDCLLLNVYTKELPINGQLKPVIAYIHGGGFYAGSAASTPYTGPELLIDRDLVLVTISYRLGSLGFMSTGTKDAPGNAGFKDQVLGLRWIKKNIAKFGGNPDLVTIAGQSAGGMSVSAHLAAEMSKGLFHRAIPMSGSIVAQWTVGYDQLHLAKKQARLVNCPEDDIEEMVKCLRLVPAPELANSLNGFKDVDTSPILIWTPVIEQDFGQERFLIDHPEVLLQSGNFSKVPVMTGVTRDEFISPVKNIVQNQTLLKMMNDDFNTVAPLCFLYDNTGEKSDKISQELKSAFLPYDVIDERAFTGLNFLFADGVISYGVHRMVHLIANHTDVYYYKFIFHGRYSHFYYPRANESYGIEHADDLLYIMNRGHIAPLFQPNDPETLAVERSTRMWENFAYTGNPNNKDDLYLRDMEWNKFDLAKENYMEVGTYLVEKNGLFLERFRVWDRLFPLIGSGSMTNHANILIMAVSLILKVLL